LDAAALRADFPILTREVRPGVPLIYLDNAATTQKPNQVTDAIAAYYHEINSNVHRGVHSFSEKATAAYEAARDKVRGFIDAHTAREIIFTRNTTEAVNLVAHAWGTSPDIGLKPGDEIILTEMEHHANIVPWQIVAERQGAHVRYIPVFDDGTLDLETYDRLLNSGRVKMVAVAHVSNVLGTINPVAEIIHRAHAVGALTLIDAAQSVPHIGVDVRALDADFLAFSGHKMVGPTGIGVLYGKLPLLEAMPPFMGGGSMIDRVTLQKTTFAAPPQKFEAGTPHIAGAVGLGAAVDYLSHIGLDAIHAHEQALTIYAAERLAAIPGVRIYGPPADQRAGLLSFTLQGIHPHDMSQGLDHAGVAVRAGHHCAMPLHDKFGIPASTRASFYLYNTFAEADAFIQAVERTRQFFAG
jgi:cysteine desulfurase/selenocysteine lyase